MKQTPATMTVLLLSLGFLLTSLGPETVNSAARSQPGAVSQRAVPVPLGETFTVNTTLSTGDGDLADDKCDTFHQHTEEADGHVHDFTGLCTLKAAIQNANKTTELDTIIFGGSMSVPATISSVSTLEAIHPISIQGPCDDPCVFLDGTGARNDTDGLLLGGAFSTVRGMGFINFPGNGIRVESDDNLIVGNYIGTQGVSDEGNGGAGISIKSSHNVIGGDDDSLGNVISGNDGGGVVISPGPFIGEVLHATENEIVGNLIGTNAGGTFAIGNGGFGVKLSASGPLFAVTDTSIKDNVISGHTLGNLGQGVLGAGVVLDGNSVTTSQVVGNIIGTDFVGTEAIPNGTGIFINGSRDNTIGGTDSAENNWISGNAADGVFIFGLGASVNVVQGNFIGVTGPNNTLGNGGSGVRITAPGNLVGGDSGTTPGDGCSGACNVISDNALGISIIETSPSSPFVSGNQVFGNLIGTDLFGEAAALGQQDIGVKIVGASGNFIGSGTPEGRNIISGNISIGIAIDPILASDGTVQRSATDNTIYGNFIGVDATGTTAVGNLLGINLKGDNHDLRENVVSGNSGSGIRIEGNSNDLYKNRIGTDLSGTMDLGNEQGGLVVRGLNNCIGTLRVFAGTNGECITTELLDEPQEANIISGNNGTGVFLGGEGGNTVLFSTIGLTMDRSGPLPNGGDGIEIFEGTENKILQSTIAGNLGEGIWIAGGLTQVSGNMIGTNGTADLGNGANGVLIERGDNIGIGEAPSGTGQALAEDAINVISGNGGAGLRILAGKDSEVLGNFIGMNAVGDAVIPNDGHGINLDEAAGETLEGIAIEDNFISGNLMSGVRIDGADFTSIQGNSIGVEPYAGQLTLARFPNQGHGVLIEAGDFNVLGETPPTPFVPSNVISGNNLDGVYISGGNNNEVKGNFIGLVEPGNIPMRNLDGVHITGAARSTVIENNFISGNTRSGIGISGGSSSQLRANHIGTGVPGVATPAVAEAVEAVPNGGAGVYVTNSTGNEIGQVFFSNGIEQGTNVISGNHGPGVHLDVGADSNFVFNNMIGLDEDGALTVERPGLPGSNGGGGIVVDGDGNTIGRPPAFDFNTGEFIFVGNVISGNKGAGVLITGDDGNIVQFNRIGTDGTGTKSTLGMGNLGAGVEITGAQRAVLVQTPLVMENVIGGNQTHGILLGGTASDVVVSGNSIGVTPCSPSVDPTTVIALPNELDGIYVTAKAHDNGISDNCIWFNGGNGVRVDGTEAKDNEIRRNSIHGNLGKGIKNLNGGNEELAPPQGALIGLSVVGSACPFCAIDVYSDPEEQGKVYLASGTADDQGNFTISAFPVADGDIITCTATNPFFSQNVRSSTSEFGCGAFVSLQNVDGLVTLQGRTDDFPPGVGHGIATVTLSPGGHTSDVAADGSFSIADVPDGTYTATAEALGYLSREKTSVVVQGDPVTLPPTELRCGLVNGDTVADLLDLLAIAASLGATVENRVDASGNVVDQNGDGTVDVLDLVCAGSNFALESPMPWE